MSPSLPPGVNSFGLWGSCGKASYKFHKRVFLQLLSSVSCARVCSHGRNCPRSERLACSLPLQKLPCWTVSFPWHSPVRACRSSSRARPLKPGGDLGCAVRRRWVNLFVFIVNIHLPVAVIHLWTFFWKHSAGGSFY